MNRQRTSLKVKLSNYLLLEGGKIMHFIYCPYCGGKLISKEIGDEGNIPFCDSCNIPLWDMFTTSIIAAVVNEYREIALLRSVGRE